MAYMEYVEQWSNGEGEHANKPKMSKEEWRKMMKIDDSPSKGSSRRSSILVGEKED